MQQNTGNEIDNILLSLETRIRNKEQELKERKASAIPVSMMEGVEGVLSKLNLSSSKVENVFNKMHELYQVTFDKANKEIKEDPWKFMAKLAAMGFALGFFVSSAKKMKG